MLPYSTVYALAHQKYTVPTVNLTCAEASAEAWWAEAKPLLSKGEQGILLTFNF
jgi:hypothetical protein